MKTWNYKCPKCDHVYDCINSCWICELDEVEINLDSEAFWEGCRDWMDEIWWYDWRDGDSE